MYLALSALNIFPVGAKSLAKSLAESLGSDYMHDSRIDSLRDSFFYARLAQASRKKYKNVILLSKKGSLTQG